MAGLATEISMENWRAGQVGKTTAGNKGLCRPIKWSKWIPLIQLKPSPLKQSLLFSSLSKSIVTKCPSKETSCKWSSILHGTTAEGCSKKNKNHSGNNWYSSLVLNIPHLIFLLLKAFHRSLSIPLKICFKKMMLLLLHTSLANLCHVGMTI